MSEVRLQVKHVSKNFGITKALKDVSFNINKGEVHALIGENGSGKSTMTNMLTGIYTLESGQFILDGKEVHPKNQVEANEEGISIIVQELGTLSGLTVAENIFLGHEDQFVHLGIKNTAAMNKKANELLQSYGFDKIKAGDMIDDYNFEDRKLVEIVKVYNKLADYKVPVGTLKKPKTPSPWPMARNGGSPYGPRIIELHTEPRTFLAEIRSACIGRSKR